MSREAININGHAPPYTVTHMRKLHYPAEITAGTLAALMRVWMA